MAELKRAVRKETKTTATFAKHDVRNLLLRAAGAPLEAVGTACLHDVDGDELFGDFCITWTIVETEGEDN